MPPLDVVRSGSRIQTANRAKPCIGKLRNLDQPSLRSVTVPQDTPPNSDMISSPGAHPIETRCRLNCIAVTGQVVDQYATRTNISMLNPPMDRNMLIHITLIVAVR